jgi:lipid A 3-O-deacylase
MPQSRVRTAPEPRPATGGQRHRAPAPRLLAAALLLALLSAALPAAAQEAPAEEPLPQDAATSRSAADSPGGPSASEPVTGQIAESASGRGPAQAPLSASVPSPVTEPPRRPEWVVSAGAFGVLDGTREGQGTVEMRLGPWTRLPLFEGLPVEPAFGLTGTSEGSAYLYSTLRFDLLQTIDWLSGRVYARGGVANTPRRWQIVPFTGVGLYEPGDGGKALGGVVEFRSGLEISVNVNPRSRVGLAFYHLSNAGIYDANPGSESLVLSWSWR